MTQTTARTSTFRSVLVQPSSGQKSVKRKTNTKSGKYSSFDTFDGFKGVTQLRTGKPITAAQTLHAMLQLRQSKSKDPAIKNLMTVWNPDSNAPEPVSQKNVMMSRLAQRDIARHAAEMRGMCRQNNCSDTCTCTVCKSKNHLTKLKYVYNTNDVNITKYFSAQSHNMQIQSKCDNNIAKTQPVDTIICQSYATTVRKNKRFKKMEKRPYPSLPQCHQTWLPLLNLKDCFVSPNYESNELHKLDKAIALYDTGSTSSYFTKEFLARTPYTVLKDDQIITVSTLSEENMVIKTQEVSVIFRGQNGVKIKIDGYAVDRIMDFKCCTHLLKSVKQICQQKPTKNRLAHVFNTTRPQSVDMLIGNMYCQQISTHETAILKDYDTKLPICSYYHTRLGTSTPHGAIPISCKFNKQGQCSELLKNHVTHHIRTGKRNEGNAALAEALSAAWKYEFLETDKTEKLTQAELECYNFTLANLEYDAKTPIYTVKLPWIGGIPPILPNTFRVARSRFLAMERQLKHRMESNPETKDHIYNLVEDSVQGNIDAGYWKPLPEELSSNYMDPANTSVYFAPPRLVWRLDHESTPVRFTFDCSQKCPNVSYSLNDCQHIGHRLLPDIPVLIMRLRSYKTVCQLDLKKMFLSVRVHGSPYQDSSDIPKQCFLWRKPLTNDPIKIYYSDRVFWGSKSAPYLASAVVNEHLRTQLKTAQENKDALKIEACELLMKSIYADDVMFSYPCSIKCIKLIDEIESILALAGFKTAKWKSNDEKVLNYIRKTYGNEKLSKTHQQLFLPAAQFQSLDAEREKLEEITEVVAGEDKALGIMLNNCWNKFSFGGHHGLYKELKDPNKVHTIRTLARAIAVSAYDPIGISSPFTLQCRHIMREVMKRNKALGIKPTKEMWNTPLFEDLEAPFKAWYEQLPHLDNLKLNACIYFKPGNTAFFCFCDASNVGIGMAIYSRSDMPNGKIKTNLVRAKSKVRPMSMPIKDEESEEKSTVEDEHFSIPRLELMAAEELLKHIKELQEAYDVNPEDLWCYTDSSCVFFWLQTETAKLLPFVANRCMKIHQAKVTFRFCPSGVQAADIVAKGSDVSELIQNEMWHFGPRFIREGKMEEIEIFHPQKLDKKHTKYLLGIRKAKLQQCLQVYDIDVPIKDTATKINYCTKILQRKPYLNLKTCLMNTLMTTNVVRGSSVITHLTKTRVNGKSTKQKSLQDPISKIMEQFSKPEEIYSKIRVFLKLARGLRESISKNITLKDGMKNVLTNLNQIQLNTRAEMLCINRYQKEKFGDEFVLLQKGEPIPNTSQLYGLNPILMEEHNVPIIKMNSRLINAPSELIPEDTRRPIILAKPDFRERNDHAVKIMKNTHNKHGHCREGLIDVLQQKYHIIGGKVACRTLSKICILCSRAVPRKANAKQISAALPIERLDPSVGCFTRISLDTCGPFELHSGWNETEEGSVKSTKAKRNKKVSPEEATEYLKVQPTLKAHVLVISCLATRYACFYLIPSLSAKDIIAGLEWHIGTFGPPKKILSDNFSSLRNVATTLKDIRDRNPDQFDKFALDWNFDWIFTPPYTAWRNGCAESHVRLLKESLAKTFDGHKHTFFDMLTTIKFMELHINARPLLSNNYTNNVEDLCLTPQKLCFGKNLDQLEISQDLMDLCPTDLEQLYKKRYLLQEHFVKVFKEKYLVYLRKRSCWKGNELPALKVGDICLWAGPDLTSKTPLPKKEWPICKIIDSTLSDDKVTRTYHIKIILKTGTGKNSVKWVLKKVPAQALCRLESMAHAQDCIFRQKDAEIAEKAMKKGKEPEKVPEKVAKTKRGTTIPNTDRVLRSKRTKTLMTQMAQPAPNPNVSLTYDKVKERRNEMHRWFCQFVAF